MRILEKKNVYVGYTNMVEFTVKSRNQSFKRVISAKVDDKGNVNDRVVCGIVHNIDKDTYFFVRQERPALYDKVDANITEVVAGTCGFNEDIMLCFMRECYEELNIKLNSKNVSLISTQYTSPGRLGEVIYFFYAKCTENDIDRTKTHGGLEEEHEFIEILEVPYTMLYGIHVEDLKTAFLISQIDKYRNTEVNTYTETSKERVLLTKTFTNVLEYRDFIKRDGVVFVSVEPEHTELDEQTVITLKYYKK